MSQSFFSGITTALVSPFKEGLIDEDSFVNLLHFQYENGVRNFVINGTTGESPTLTEHEVQRLIRVFDMTLDRKQCALMVGTGSNSTRKTIELSLKVKMWGADALLVVVPYYNKPTQLGLKKHFTEIADKVRHPIFLYNVPGRTITSLSFETIYALSENPYIYGIKEASGDLELARKMARELSSDFVLLSGDDESWLSFMGVGGHGVISVISHLIPKLMVQYYEKASRHDHNVARFYQKYKTLCDLLFSEPNPCPVKTGLKSMGVIRTDDVRLPLLTTSMNHKEKLEREMSQLGVL